MKVKIYNQYLVWTKLYHPEEKLMSWNEYWNSLWWLCKLNKSSMPEGFWEES